MPQLNLTVVLDALKPRQILDSNPGRIWISGQSLGPGRITIKPDSPPKDINDGAATVFQYGTFADQGDGVHRGKWYAIADQADTRLLLTEASQG